MPGHTAQQAGDRALDHIISVSLCFHWIDKLPTARPQNTAQWPHQINAGFKNHITVGVIAN